MKVGDMEANRAYWNGRAASFASGGCARSEYVDGFLGRLGLADTWSVFDMGCGPGTLALPLARDGFRVQACDFSQSMLQILCDRAQSEGLSIDTKLLAWEDDWMANGVEDKSFDVAIASRSIKKRSLPEMLEKMERVAREVVAVTVPASPAPFVDVHLLEHLGRPVPENRVDQELVRILASWGRYPNLSYLNQERHPSFPTREGLADDMRRLAGNEPMTEAEEALLAKYVEAHEVVECGDEGELHRLDYALPIVWGLIVWRPDGAPLS